MAVSVGIERRNAALDGRAKLYVSPSRATLDWTVDDLLVWSFWPLIERYASALVADSVARAFFAARGTEPSLIRLARIGADSSQPVITTVMLLDRR